MIYHMTGQSFVKYGDEGRDLSDLGSTVTQAAKALKPHVDQFHSIVVTGMSGVLVGAPVALKLKKPLVVIRKESDDAHHGGGRILNDRNMGNRVLFLDDFVAGGNTTRRVEKVVKGKGGRIVATLMYRDMQLMPAKDKEQAFGVEAYTGVAKVGDQTIPF